VVAVGELLDMSSVVTKTIAFVVTDPYGQTDVTCTQEIDVVSSTDTGIANAVTFVADTACPRDIDIYTDLGSPVARYELPNPQHILASNIFMLTWDVEIVNLQGTSVAYNPTDAVNLDIDTHEITYTASDQFGVVVGECVYDVTVTDNEFPTITCPRDYTVQTDADSNCFQATFDSTLFYDSANPGTAHDNSPDWVVTGEGDQTLCLRSIGTERTHELT
jgi:hypothetical protein